MGVDNADVLPQAESRRGDAQSQGKVSWALQCIPCKGSWCSCHLQVLLSYLLITSIEETCEGFRWTCFLTFSCRVISGLLRKQDDHDRGTSTKDLHRQQSLQDA